MISTFGLERRFLSKFSKIPADFGWKSGPNSVGEIVCARTYSRFLEEAGRNEQWSEICARVVNGCYRMQEMHVRGFNLEWNDDQAQRSAQEMYTRMFHMKFLPPGRGLWCMGTAVTEKRKIHAALMNCAFVSTANLAVDKYQPFCFLMDASMLGVGVGFDTKGAGKLKIKGSRGATMTYRIPDTREGWVESVKLLILSYTNGMNPVEFIYSDIRVRGLPIRTFGGLSSGPECLIELHRKLREILDSYVGLTLDTRAIVDIMNLIGVCVVAGNVRRTAEIAFGEPGDLVFSNLKNYTLFPERQAYGWTSNNSIFANVGQSYDQYREPVCANGEPGFAWLQNMRDYGRMDGRPNFIDTRVSGGNPCLEQSLESYELCCLVETFVNRHKDLEDFKRTLKFAYLYAKTVTLGQTHWVDSNRVMLRNRRIGCSISGVQQFIVKQGMGNFRNWCRSGYDWIQNLDKTYSEWLCIPRSIKTTSIKPSGTVSLLTGSTPGMHWPVCNFHIRRVTLAKNSPIANALIRAGYHVEDAVYDTSSVVVEIPTEPEVVVRDVAQVSIWEQLEMAAMLQEHWADNQVSCTVTFDPETEGKDLPRALDVYQYRLKGVSFLPQKKIPMDTDEGVKAVRGAEKYKQMPYSPITRAEYDEKIKGVKRIDFRQLVSTEGGSDRFCSGEKCELPQHAQP